MESTILSFEQAVKDEGPKQYFIKLILLAIVYILAAQAGLSLAFSFRNITTIWPATGIAMTALLLWGYHYWPAIFVGAFIANTLGGVTPPIATGIALGNTLEAMTAILLIKKFIPHGDILDRISGVVYFVGLGVFTSTLIAATLGVLSLRIGGVISGSEVTSAWLTWWVGDIMGALIILPFVAAWQKHKYREQLSGHIYEAIAMLLLIVMVSLLIFTQSVSSARIGLPLVYIIFPLIIMAGVRFTQIGAVTAGMVITLVALWGTLAGTGPYAQSGSIEQNIFSLHFFLFVAIVTALVLSVAVYERLRSEKALIRQAAELEEAKEEILLNIASRKDMQTQMQDATSQINEILTGIFEGSKDKTPRHKS